jgi:chromosome segregation ATPase
MIGEIVYDVGIAVGGTSVDNGDGDDHEVRITRHSVINEEHRDIERKLRSLQREMRRLGEDIRDKQIEALQAEENSRAQLDAALKEMESKIGDLEKEQDGLRKQLADARQERNREREKIKAEAAARKQARNSRIENIVITAFCDYGASLKSLPEKEKVTILFENDGSQWSAEKSKIYVIDKSDLYACQKGKINRDDLAANATTYQF